MDDIAKLPDADMTPEQAAALERSLARGEAQFLAGQAIPGDAVFAWLRSWGTAQELPAPERPSAKN
jgi:predicted transcriptional regulator